MAKPKLSTEEKAALREQLQKRLKAGEQQSKVLEDLGSKFKVSPETVRYYSKQLAGPDGKPTRGKAETKTGVKKAARRPKRRTAASKKNGRGQVSSLQAVISNYEPRELERALKASKLFKELQTQRERTRSLQIELRGSKRAAAKLERQIKRLVRT